MSIRFQIDQTLPAPPERVFRELTDLENAGRWMPGFVRFERVGDVQEGAGMRFRETRKMFGKEATEEFEVTAFEPPSRLGLRVDGSRGSSGGGIYDFEYRLSPAADGGTHVRLDASITGTSRVMAWIGRLFVGMYRKAIEKDLKALAEYLASTPETADV